MSRLLLPVHQPLLQLGAERWALEMQHQFGVEHQGSRIQIEAAKQRLPVPDQDQLGMQAEGIPLQLGQRYPLPDHPGTMAPVSTIHQGYIRTGQGVGEDLDIHPSLALLPEPTAQPSGQDQVRTHQLQGARVVSQLAPEQGAVVGRDTSPLPGRSNHTSARP